MRVILTRVRRHSVNSVSKLDSDQSSSTTNLDVSIATDIPRASSVGDLRATDAEYEINDCMSWMRYLVGRQGTHETPLNFLEPVNDRRWVQMSTKTCGLPSADICRSYIDSNADETIFGTLFHTLLEHDQLSAVLQVTAPIFLRRLREVTDLCRSSPRRKYREWHDRRAHTARQPQLRCAHRHEEKVINRHRLKSPSSTSARANAWVPLLRQLSRDHGETIVMMTHDTKAAEYESHMASG